MVNSKEHPSLHQESEKSLKELETPSPNNMFRLVTTSHRSFTRSRSSLLPEDTYKDFFTTNFGFPEEWHEGNLPHRNRKNLVQSITFRLADSLPQEKLRDLEDEFKTLSKSKRDTLKRIRYDELLDKGLGCCALNHPEMAQVVLNALHFYNGERYNLLAWSIMPNHVHVLIETAYDLSKIIQSWKSYTGKWAFANNMKYALGIADDAKQFWIPEYWDRFIRDDAHFDNVLNYILQNPTKANLGESSTASKFTGSVFD